jgi:hypothetical protein
VRISLVFQFSLLTGIAFSTSSVAQELMVFPNEDQSKEQQQEDEFTCYNWAKGETGFDPMAVPTATEAPPQQEAQKGGVGRGAVRGAAVGQIVGGQKRKEEAERQQWEQEQQQIYAENRNRYNRAYAACMEGKNYTVR